jgi:DNA-directed RNA polymerase I, II, and III subunit RPABC2
MSYTEPNDLLKNLLKGKKDDDDDEEAEEAKSDIGSDIENDEDDVEVENSEVEDDDESEIEDENDLEGGGLKPKVKTKGGAGPGASAGAGAGAEESSDDDDMLSSSDDDDDYLQKFNQEIRNDLILNFHPESRTHNYEEIKQLAKVTRNKNGIIVDELHKTIPILTKYERTRILGQRTKQIESGGATLVQVPPNVIDSYLIAKLELEQNKIPFIIRRPLPNGGMEYWYVSDLENTF